MLILNRFGSRSWEIGFLSTFQIRGRSKSLTVSSSRSLPVGRSRRHRVIFRWRSTKPITAYSWQPGPRRECLFLTRRPGRKSRPVKLRVLRTTSSTIRGAAASTCSPEQAFSKCSKTETTIITTGSRITQRRPTPKLTCSFPNGEDSSPLCKDKVSKAPRSACMRQIEAQKDVPTSRVYAYHASVGRCPVTKLQTDHELRSYSD